jgi:hypothetical protein
MGKAGIDIELQHFPSPVLAGIFRENDVLDSASPVTMIGDTTRLITDRKFNPPMPVMQPIAVVFYGCSRLSFAHFIFLRYGLVRVPTQSTFVER